MLPDSARCYCVTVNHRAIHQQHIPCWPLCVSLFTHSKSLRHLVQRSPALNSCLFQVSCISLFHSPSQHGASLYPSPCTAFATPYKFLDNAHSSFPHQTQPVLLAKPLKFLPQIRIRLARLASFISAFHKVSKSLILSRKSIEAPESVSGGDHKVRDNILKQHPSLVRKVSTEYRECIRLKPKIRRQTSENTSRTAPSPC